MLFLDVTFYHWILRFLQMLQILSTVFRFDFQFYIPFWILTEFSFFFYFRLK